MADHTLSYETVYTLAMQLSRAERARLIAQIASTLVEEPGGHPRRSLRGILSGYGPAPSAEDIDQPAAKCGVTSRERTSDDDRGCGGYACRRVVLIR